MPDICGKCGKDWKMNKEGTGCDACGADYCVEAEDFNDPLLKLYVGMAAINLNITADELRSKVLGVN